MSSSRTVSSPPSSEPPDEASSVAGRSLRRKTGSGPGLDAAVHVVDLREAQIRHQSGRLTAAVPRPAVEDIAGTGIELGYPIDEVGGVEVDQGRARPRLIK